jgi:hypothetical protein
VLGQRRVALAEVVIGVLDPDLGALALRDDLADVALDQPAEVVSVDTTSLLAILPRMR